MSVACAVSDGWSAKILTEQGLSVYALSRRRGRASVAGIIAQPVGVNRRGLASRPWQSPGSGPPICCLRQLALEASHRVQCRSARLARWSSACARLGRAWLWEEERAQELGSANRDAEGIAIRGRASACNRRTRCDRHVRKAPSSALSPSSWRTSRTRTACTGGPASWPRSSPPIRDSRPCPSRSLIPRTAEPDDTSSRQADPGS